MLAGLAFVVTSLPETKNVALESMATLFQVDGGKSYLAYAKANAADCWTGLTTLLPERVLRCCAALRGSTAAAGAMQGRGDENAYDDLEVPRVTTGSLAFSRLREEPALSS